MPQRSLDDFRRHVAKAWGSGPESALSLVLLDLLQRRAEEMSHVTYGYLLDLASRERIKDPQVVARVAQYFADAQLLQLRFEFIDDDDQIYDVSVADVNEARRTGTFFNPGTGQLEPDFEEKLFVYFAASPEAVELSSRAGG